MDPAIHQAVNDLEVEVGLHGSDPPSNVVPFQSHHHVVGQIGCHENSYSFLDHSSDQASAPFLFDPYGHILADCSSALQSSRSVHRANNLWLLALNAPEDLVRQSHRNHPCGYRLSVRLWEGGEEEVVASEDVHKEGSCPEMLEAHRLLHRSHFLCQPQTAVGSDHDVEVLC